MTPFDLFLYVVAVVGGFFVGRIGGVGIGISIFIVAVGMGCVGMHVVGWLMDDAEVARLSRRTKLPESDPQGWS